MAAGEALERRIQELEEELKDKISDLLQLVDHKRAPFTYLMLEMNVNRHQVKDILDLMEEAKKSLATTKPMNGGEFEIRVYDIVPERKGDFHFAESIVGTLFEENRWVEVAEHMAKNGMNPDTVLGEKSLAMKKPR